MVGRWRAGPSGRGGARWRRGRRCTGDSGRRGRNPHRVGHHQSGAQVGGAGVAAVVVVVGVLTALWAEQQAVVGQAPLHPGTHGGSGIHAHPTVCHISRQRGLTHNGGIEIAAGRRPGRAGAGQGPGGAVGDVAGTGPEVPTGPFGPIAGHAVESKLHRASCIPLVAVEFHGSAVDRSVTGQG